MADFATWKAKNKALWERVYDEIFVPDLEAEWGKRAKIYAQESRQDQEHRRNLTDQLNDERRVKTDLEVIDEISNSKRQRQNELRASASYDEDFNTGGPNATAVEYRRLADKFDELSKKYQDISQKVNYLEKKNAAVMQKNKNMKESVRAWQEYADRQSGKRKIKDEIRAKDGQFRLSVAHYHQENRPHAPFDTNLAASSGIFLMPTDLDHSSPVPAGPPIQQAPGPHDWSISPDLSPQNVGRGSEASVTPRAKLQYDRTHSNRRDSNDLDQNFFLQDQNLKSRDGRHIGSRLCSFHPGSSQTTEDERGEDIFHNPQNPDAEVDDEIPQFVSARSLKRKRVRPSKSEFGIFVDQFIEGTPEKPFRVKDEQLSSPPIGTYKMMRTEPVDLDAPTPNVLRTPRHPRRKASLHSKTTGTLHYQRSNSAPFTQGIKRESSEMAADLSDFHTELVAQRDIAADFRACSEPSDPTQNELNILQPLDSNALVEAPKGKTRKRTKRTKILHEADHDVLAESGEERPPNYISKLRLPPHATRAQLNRRSHISKILQPPSENVQEATEPDPAKAMPKQIPTPAFSSRSTITPLRRTRLRNRIITAHSSPQDRLTLDDRPIWMMGDPQPRSTTRKVHIRPSKEQQRLRNTPPAELKINDFKPNPAFNQGYSYAFSETLRKRGDRMCVPGCTNLQCCGSTFRAFAEARLPLSESQEEALLEEYLGDAYNNMQLTQVSSEERVELVLQARTKKMADESGKHREAYTRHRTPPGFWRVDFPTTQEQQEDREKAKEQEKNIIRERWLEAQRKGGRWLFRDE